jgi:hypothetical protein
MPKKKKAKRDIEKGYTTKQMVAKLRRLVVVTALSTP